MEALKSAAARRARWVLTSALAGAIAGLGAPALLHGQTQSSRATDAAPAVAATAANVQAKQRVPAPPDPAAPAPRVAPRPAPPLTPQAADAMQLGRAFTEVAEHVLPSVVSIRVEAEAEQGQNPIPFLIPFMAPDAPPAVVRGAGSGVIVREDGVILTNHHVVARARRLEVRLRDGRTLRARVLGADAATDLALIKVDARGLPAARLGDSDAARVGEWVLAIGAPMGLEATVTHGVVSATGRGGIGANEIEDYLQTDASINPGNSGGPLVNLRGEVLGINTMIIGRNTGIGMAVPSRLAQNVMEQILRTGRVERAWIGVGVQDLSDALARTMGLGVAHGAVVNEVQPGGPAARAGLRVGDVITAVDGRAVASSHDVVRAITRAGVGQRVALSVTRGRRAENVAVVTGARPRHDEVAASGGGAGAGGADGAQPRSPSRGLGIRVAPVPPQLAARAGGSADGALVAAVEPGSPADDAGLRPGDVIVEADGRAVRSPDDLRAATQDRRAALLVRRGDRQLFVAVDLDR